MESYNQIPIDTNDEEKTSFVTERGIYCYRVMPFGLKNAGATYQRLVSKIFKDQMGKTVEAYIDDMVVKNKKAAEHLEHLQDVFGVLRRYGMKLNPTKCSFDVSSGQFLGYVVNNRGIKASPAQAEALIKNAEPRTIKEVQALTGRIAALSRFISKLSDRCKPFFDTIRGHGKQVWGMSNESIATNAVLVRCDEGKQFPVFYVNKTMAEPKRRTFIKGQAVTDFLLECDAEDMEEDLGGSSWKLFIDGSSNQMGAGIRIKMQTPEGAMLSQAVRLEFRATNNEAEYEALLAGLKLAKELKVRSLVAFSDSQLIIRQVTGEYGTKDKTMEAYRSVVLHEAKDFDQIKFIQLPREYNEDADRLAYSASGSG
ncbi:uncharacterized protein LOC132296362 [Cornus florida]|uniref:uncharacterized protein LOC132296362 n=1 Tax=Cornus florida TaxID=4283 RepID=UPI00289B9B71|nr:uncharacterized protein LOC132296362 [Cornus florida]